MAQPNKRTLKEILYNFGFDSEWLAKEVDTVDEAEHVFKSQRKALDKLHHPDQYGSNEEFVAWERIKDELDHYGAGAVYFTNLKEQGVKKRPKKKSRTTTPQTKKAAEVPPHVALTPFFDQLFISANTTANLFTSLDKTGNEVSPEDIIHTEWYQAAAEETNQRISEEHITDLQQKNDGIQNRKEKQLRRSQEFQDVLSYFTKIDREGSNVTPDLILDTYVAIRSLVQEENPAALKTYEDRLFEEAGMILRGEHLHEHRQTALDGLELEIKALREEYKANEITTKEFADQKKRIEDFTKRINAQNQYGNTFEEYADLIIENPDANQAYTANLGLEALKRRRDNRELRTSENQDVLKLDSPATKRAYINARKLIRKGWSRRNYAVPLLADHMKKSFEDVRKDRERFGSRDPAQAQLETSIEEIESLATKRRNRARGLQNKIDNNQTLIEAYKQHAGPENVPTQLSDAEDDDVYYFIRSFKEQNEEVPLQTRDSMHVHTKHIVGLDRLRINNDLTAEVYGFNPETLKPEETDDPVLTGRIVGFISGSEFANQVKPHENDVRALPGAIREPEHNHLQFKREQLQSLTENMQLTGNIDFYKHPILKSEDTYYVLGAVTK